MWDNVSDNESQPLTSNAEQAPVCAGAWRRLQVASCSLPLRAQPSGDARDAHALCVTLLDELKVEVHVVVRHRVRQWRRVAESGKWCAVAGLLSAPFQHNARVWRTCPGTRVRACAARGVRAHLSPRAWQEQHLRTRAGRFVVARRLRSGDLVLRALPDGTEFLLVTYFSSNIACLPRIPPGALVSLHGASCLGHQGVLAMCARTDLRVIDLADNEQVEQTFAHAAEGQDGEWKTFWAQRSENPQDRRDQACEIVQQHSDSSDARTFGRSLAKKMLEREKSDETDASFVRQCGEVSVNGKTSPSGTKLVDCESRENIGETSYLNAVSALFCSPQAGKGFNSPSQLQKLSGEVQNTRLGIVSDIKETSSHTERHDGAVGSTFRVKLPNTRRFFDESPRLYRPATKPPRIPLQPTVEDKTSAFGSDKALQRFPIEELEDEGDWKMEEDGAWAYDVKAKNLAQYLWYLDMVIKFRGRFGDVAGSGSLELAVAKLLGLLNSEDSNQDCDEALNTDVGPLDPCHCLTDSILSDCFSDDHVCPLVAGAETSFAVQLGLEAIFQETLRTLLERSSGSGSTESASVSERLRNVVGILELSPHGFWLLRQPRFDGAALRRRNLRSVAIESDAAARHFDSGFQSQEDSPTLIDSDFQSHRNSKRTIDSDSPSRQISQMNIDTDSQSQQWPHSFTDSSIASQSSSQTSPGSGNKYRPSVFPKRSPTDETEKTLDSFVAVVINAEWDAAMHGRLVLLAECRLVAERGTAHETPAGLWLDSQLVQDLARLRLPSPPLPPPPPSLPVASCPLCADAVDGVEHCDERWDPDLDSLAFDSGSNDPATWDPGSNDPATWDPGSRDPGTWDRDPSPEPWDSGLGLNGLANPGPRDHGTEGDPAFVASSLASRHRFVMHATAAPAIDVDGRRSCLVLVSLVTSFAQPSPGRLAVLALCGAQLRWLPQLRARRGFTLRGCVCRVRDVAALPAYRMRCNRAAMERHDCAHRWQERTPQGMRSLAAKVVATNAVAEDGGIGAVACFSDSAWLDVCADDGRVLRLYLRGWGRRCPPRAMILGARVHIACVRERTSAVGRGYLHPTPLTSITVLSLGAAEPAWWAATLPPVALPGATAGLLPPRCVRWALAAARCTRCNAAKRAQACDRCGLAEPGRARVTLRLRAATDVELIAVDDVAAVVLGYTALGWQALIDRVSRTCGTFEWAGPDDEVPEDRDLAPCGRRFYAACRSQPTAPMAVRCRRFNGRDGGDVRFVLEARKPS